MNKLLIILFFLAPTILLGQTIYEHHLDENKLSELKENIRHLTKKPERWTYDTEKEFQDAVRRYDQRSENGSGSKNAGEGKQGSNSIGDKEAGYESPEYREETDSYETPDFDMPKMNLGPIGQVLLYIFLGALLAALIYFLFISSSFKNNGAKYVPLDIEDISPADIPKTELERMLDEALAEKDYRKAVRIYYLFILKDLSEKKWIAWEKQKTNMHYLLEMQSKSEAPAFEKVLTYFEFIWYGKRNITEKEFSGIQPSFLQLLRTLNIK